MPQLLTDMTIDEISLVDDGANEAARVVIVKAKTKAKPKAGEQGYDEEADPNELEPDGDADDAGEGKAKAMKKSALSGQAMTGGNSVDPDAANSAAASFKEFQMDIENLSKALEDAEAKLVALEKRANDAEAALTNAEAVIKAKDAEIAEIAKAAPAAEEDVYKGLPESIRKRLEDADAAAKAAQDEITKMRVESETKEFIAKAKTLGATDAEKVGGLLMRVAKGMTTSDDANALESMLKAAGEQGKTAALFKSLGSDTAADGDPEAMLVAKAADIAKSSNGKLTKEQAYAQAVDENPALYNAYVSKRRSA